MNWLKKHLMTIILVLVLFLGVGLLLYPTASDYWNSVHQSGAIMSYAKTVAELDEKECEELLDAAKAYNQEIAQNGICWTLTEKQKEDYEKYLNITGTGSMGYIDIPKIHVKLPVYHGTDAEILKTSIGHIEGTSLPVGGLGSHCVLSGHRGLPSARLFTDLDKLVKGDTFSLTILNETFTYEVDQIRIVEPTDFSELQIVEGEDYCTLVTCTPYGINTQRLLVRGRRVDNPQGNANVTADALQIEPLYIVPFIAVPICIVLFILVMITTHNAVENKRNSEK